MLKYSCLLAAACLSEMNTRLLPKISRILGPHDLLSNSCAERGGGGGGLKCRKIDKFVRST